MYSLLPEKYIAQRRKDYRLRVMIVLLCGLAAAALVGAGALAPAFILSHSLEADAVTTAAAIKKDREDRGIDKIQKELSQTQPLIDALAAQESGIAFSSLVESLTARQSSGIMISSIQIARVEGTSSATYEVSGVATTREALIGFKKSIEEDPRFGKVDLPVSGLAKSRDIHFSIHTTLTWRASSSTTP